MAQKYGSTEKPYSPSGAALIPTLVALVTFSVFSRALFGGFVSLDDDVNFIGNFAYRGFRWPQIHWMFTTTITGPYQPFSWLTYGLDYSLWGMKPFGYHLTNVLLHSANAALFYLLCSRLIRSIPSHESDSKNRYLPLASACAALLFSIHPLRVESVAWITERRDVLSGFFYLSSILAYLSMCGVERFGHNSTFRKACPVFLFAGSLLAKGSGVGLPITLLALDIYPLQRLSGNWRDWFSPQTRSILLEKIPYLLLSAGAAAVGVYGQKRGGTIVSLAEIGIPSRCAQVFYSIFFYIRKTLIPTHLMPAHERSLHINLFSAEHIIGAMTTIAFIALIIASRKRRPAVTVAGIHYLAALAPVIGIFQFGANTIADRYSYLPCLCWPILIAGYISSDWGTFSYELRTAIRAFAIICLAILGIMTWRQIGIWHDSDALWNYVLKLQPEHSLANNNIGADLISQRRADEAIPYLRRALTTDPSLGAAHNNLGSALLSLGRLNEALAEYQEALRLTSRAETHSNIADIFSREGRQAEAEEEYKAALAIDPTNPQIKSKLAKLYERSPVDPHEQRGSALASQGKWDEALSEYRESLRLNPSAEAYNNIANALYATGRTAEAEEDYKNALKKDSTNPEIYFNLGLVYTRQNRFGPATEEYQRALRLAPQCVPCHINIAYTLASDNHPNEALSHCREALRLDPGNAQAQRLMTQIISHGSAEERGPNMAK